MTFRKDSDIIDSYGGFVGKSGEKPPISSYTYTLKPKGLLQTT